MFTKNMFIKFLLLALLHTSCSPIIAKKENEPTDIIIPSAPLLETHGCLLETETWVEEQLICMSNEAYCSFKNDGSLWEKGQCLSLQDQCLNKKNGSIWRDGICLSAQKACDEDRGIWRDDRCYVSKAACDLQGTLWKWNEERCLRKTFLDFCQDPQDQDGEIRFTVDVLLESAGHKSCVETNLWLNEQTTLYFEEGHKKIVSIAPLANLKKLKVLTMPNQAIKDLDVLSSLSNLESLDLENSGEIEDISALRDLTLLTHLNLANNKIFDLKPLSGLSQLKTLYLWKNQISDISSLSQLKELTELHIRNNGIRDISPLGRLLKLDQVSLENNPINKSEPTCPTQGADIVQVIKDICR